MSKSLEQQAEDLGIEVDGRWSHSTLKQKVADAKEARESMDRDVSNPDMKRNADMADVKPVDTSKAQDVPNIGVMRVESSAEIRARELGDSVGPAPTDDPKAAHKAAQERAKAEAAYAPEFDTTGMNTAPDATTPIRLLYDWWDGQGNRHTRGETVDLVINEARKLLDDGKAERADPLPGEK